MSRPVGRLLALSAIMLLLQGCNDSLTDIQQFMESVKANTPAGIPPITKSQAFCAYQLSISECP